MLAEMMAEGLSRTWCWALIRGIAALGFALAAAVWPNPTRATLARLLAIGVLAGGVCAIAHAFRLRRWSRRWRLKLCQGVLALVFGGLTLLWPRLTLTALAMLAAALSILLGGLAAWFAFAVRRSTSGWWRPLLWGASSIGLGILAALWPDRALVVVLWLLAAGALLVGVGHLAAAFRLRHVARGVSPTPRRSGFLAGRGQSGVRWRDSRTIRSGMA